MNRIITLISFIISIYAIYKYRYRVLNTFLKRRWLRNLAVSMAMQVPFIRDKILGSVLHYRQPEQL